MRTLSKLLAISSLALGCASAPVGRSPAANLRGDVVGAGPSVRLVVVGPADIHAYSAFAGGAIYTVPAVSGSDRYDAGVLAERMFGPQLHLLDDGFQHRALARDFDIVLVTPDDARDRLLPGGRLREPLTSLRRADAVVTISGAEARSFPLDGKVVWRARRGIVARDIPERPVAFCGIARPQGFLTQLRAAGVEPAAEAFYCDHHAYTEQDVRDLLKLRDQSEAGGFVTTEKDAINLGECVGMLQPLAVVSVRMELLEATHTLEGMLRVLAERKRGS